MPGRDPVCERVLRQTQESLRAMKLHIVNYRLQILMLSVRKPVENSDTSRDNDRDDEYKKQN
jgi:hypothetical protein